MLRMKTALTCLLFYTAFYGGLLAQNKVEEHDSIAAYANTISLYRENIKENSILYSGREHASLNKRIQGHAFYGSKDWQLGDLIYWGQRYENVPLLYDIFTDEVVIRHYESPFRIKLIVAKVEQFSIYDHQFIRINPPAESAITPGFYDQLYLGGVTLLAKRKKTIKESHLEGRVMQEFEQKDRYFILKDGIYYPVGKRSSVLKVLKDQKKEVKRLMKQNNIQFWENPEYAMIKMAAFYDLAKTASE
jgi:hypothetical protein